MLSFSKYTSHPNNLLKKSVSWRLTVGNCSVQLRFLCRFGEFGKMPLIHFLPLRSVSVPPRCAAKMGNGNEPKEGKIAISINMDLEMLCKSEITPKVHPLEACILDPHPASQSYFISIISGCQLASYPTLSSEFQWKTQKSGIALRILPLCPIYWTTSKGWGNRIYPHWIYQNY